MMFKPTIAKEFMLYSEKEFEGLLADDEVVLKGLVFLVADFALLGGVREKRYTYEDVATALEFIRKHFGYSGDLLSSEYLASIYKRHFNGYKAVSCLTNSSDVINLSEDVVKMSDDEVYSVVIPLNEMTLLKFVDCMQRLYFDVLDELRMWYRKGVEGRRYLLGKEVCV